MQRPAGNGLPGVRGKENALGTVLPGKDLAAKKASGYRLSLVIPAWNEGETIRQAVQEADAALSRITTEYEILIVDDGSSDDTADLVKAEAAANPRVRLVPHSTNHGYGAALR